nr:crossover junction endonuclease MUS81 [Aegilops tauschii subsp. strangulata]
MAGSPHSQTASSPHSPHSHASSQMAPSVPRKRRVNRPENEEVAAWLFLKHRSMAEQQPGGLPEHQGHALSTAYRCVCATNVPIRTFGDLARLRGVEGWVVDVMEDSFPGCSLDLSPLRSNTPGETGKKNTRNKPYVPRLKSAAYAIMITLYRATFNQRKRERTPNNSRNSRNDGYSYTGWNSMKTLTTKDLVEKKSNPAKKFDTVQQYYLTEKGKETARDCLARSGLDGPAGPLTAAGHPAVVLSDSDSDEYDGSSPLIGINKGSERSGLPNSKAGSSSSFGIINGIFSDNGCATNSPLSSREMFGQQSFSAMVHFTFPFRTFLFQMEHNATFWPRSRRKVVDNIRSQFNIPVEIKHLPVGDALWIARHKELDTDYVLDFIVERENVDDLLGSIKDNRYKDQKLRLKKCGLRKLIYLVEGDVNTVDGSESVKTACFTTEVLEGFDVQRTTGYADTEKKYGHLTGSIIDYYSRNFSAGADTSRLCVTYDEFVKRCSDLEKVTMSDIFALQLMQVPQVTEEAALAVTSLYPTLLSLAKAYTMLDGDRRAQEEMLKKKSDMVNTGASKNIFKLIWAEG